MTRLIDADKLREKLIIDYEVRETYFGERLLEVIDNAPTIYPICEDKACKYRANERPQGDLISREALKEAFENTFYEDYDDELRTEKLIDNAPTVETPTIYEFKGCDNCELERPKGEWIEIPVERDLLYNTGIKYTCSICGTGNCYGKPPFCMYCGADMRGSKD